MITAVLRDLFGPGTWGTAGNLVATVILAGPAAIAAFLGRHRLRAWWAKHHPHKTELAAIREIAESARRIAADTFEHQTGRRHRDSPELNREDGNDDR